MQSAISIDTLSPGVGILLKKGQLIFCFGQDAQTATASALKGALVASRVAFNWTCATVFGLYTIAGYMQAKLGPGEFRDVGELPTNVFKALSRCAAHLRADALLICACALAIICTAYPHLVLGTLSLALAIHAFRIGGLLAQADAHTRKSHYLAM